MLKESNGGIGMVWKTLGAEPVRPEIQEPELEKILTNPIIELTQNPKKEEPQIGKKLSTLF